MDLIGLIVWKWKGMSLLMGKLDEGGVWFSGIAGLRLFWGLLTCWANYHSYPPISIKSKKKLAMFCCGWRWVQVECFRKSQQVLGSQSCLCLFHPRSHGGAESSISPVFVCNQISSAAISYCLAKVKELACICEIYPSLPANWWRLKQLNGLISRS